MPSESITRLPVPLYSLFKHGDGISQVLSTWIYDYGVSGFATTRRDNARMRQRRAYDRRIRGWQKESSTTVRSIGRRFRWSRSDVCERASKGEARRERYTRSSERMREGKELSPLPCRNSQDCSHTKVDPAFFMKEEEEEEELDIL